MGRGVNRTVIMSPGGRHDTQGVSGTHLAGSEPTTRVLDSIPSELGAVSDEVARPQPAPKPVAPRRVYLDDEGRPTIPRGLGTSRPTLEVTSAEKAQETAPAPAPEATGGAILPPPDLASPAESDELSGQEEPEGDLPRPSRRKLLRATLDQLKAWCAAWGLNPAEYVEDDGQVDGKLMRELLAEKLDIAI